MIVGQMTSSRQVKKKVSYYNIFLLFFPRFSFRLQTDAFLLEPGRALTGEALAPLHSGWNRSPRVSHRVLAEMQAADNLLWTAATIPVTSDISAVASLSSSRIPRFSDSRGPDRDRGLQFCFLPLHLLLFLHLGAFRRALVDDSQQPAQTGRSQRVSGA